MGKPMTVRDVKRMFAVKDKICEVCKVETAKGRLMQDDKWYCEDCLESDMWEPK